MGALMESEENRQWYKLDLSANVYPTLQSRTFSSVYRLTVTLKEIVQPGLLQQALNQTLPRFPQFRVSMRKGMFWRYLEVNQNPPPMVRPDVRNPCMPMAFNNKNRYLIRVYYYDRQISFEAFHSLSDGYGAITFLKTLTAVYLRNRGVNIPSGNGILDISEEPPAEEMEDAYIRYADSRITNKRTMEKAYILQGTKEPFYTLNIISGAVPVTEIKAAARRYDATITEYLVSALLYAILQKQKETTRPKRLRPVRIALPIDLRGFFPTESLRNFITMLYPTIDPRLGEYTFEEIVQQTRFFARYSLNDKFLKADITTNARTTQNLAVRMVPLFIKDIILRQFYTRVQNQQSSAGLTNMGIVHLPAEMEPYVERVDILMGQPFSPRTNCAIISYRDTLTINFANSIIETDIERYFFRKLVHDKIHVTIRSNRDEVM